jgi:hypothetical protein
MMTKDQSEVVKLVYNRLIESEDCVWTDIDYNIEFFNWLNDKELVKESQIKYDSHCGGVFRCSQNHEQEHCFAPYVLESVGSIISLFEETRSLHAKNRYILTYYLAMSEMKMIYKD